MLSSVWLSMHCCIIFVWCVYLYLPWKCFVAVVLSSNEQYNFALWNIVNTQRETNNCSLDSSFPSVNTSSLCCINNCSSSDRVLVTASISLNQQIQLYSSKMYGMLHAVLNSSHKNLVLLNLVLASTESIPDGCTHNYIIIYNYINRVPRLYFKINQSGDSNHVLRLRWDWDSSRAL